jgi:hypothetical protein
VGGADSASVVVGTVVARSVVVGTVVARSVVVRSVVAGPTVVTTASSPLPEQALDSNDIATRQVALVRPILIGIRLRSGLSTPRVVRRPEIYEPSVSQVSATRVAGHRCASSGR